MAAFPPRRGVGEPGAAGRSADPAPPAPGARPGLGAGSRPRAGRRSEGTQRQRRPPRTGALTREVLEWHRVQWNCGRGRHFTVPCFPAPPGDTRSSARHLQRGPWEGSLSFYAGDVKRLVPSAWAGSLR